MSKQRTVSVVVPVYNGGLLWQTVAEKINAQRSVIRADASVFIL